MPHTIFQGQDSKCRVLVNLFLFVFTADVMVKTFHPRVAAHVSWQPSQAGDIALHQDLQSYSIPCEDISHLASPFPFRRMYLDVFLFSVPLLSCSLSFSVHSNIATTAVDFLDTLLPCLIWNYAQPERMAITRQLLIAISS